MAKVFKLNKKNFRQVLTSPEMQAAITEVTQNINERCGKGYEMSVNKAKKRVHAMVFPKTRKARKDNLKNNTLLKAVRG